MAAEGLPQKVAAALQSLCTPDAADRAVDAGIIASAVGLLGWQGYKRPKTTGTVVAVWLLWFVCKIAAGQSAWAEFTGHASHARVSTEEAVRSLASMLGAWVVLFLPIVVDAEHLLAPVAIKGADFAASSWDLLSWHQRGLVAGTSLAVVGSAVAAYAAWPKAAEAAAAVCRHRNAVIEVLFQLSFAVCGPTLWWLVAHMPAECTWLVVDAAVSALPAAFTVRALLQLEKQGAGADAGYEPLPLLANDRETGDFFLREDKSSSELQQRMCNWLSYWSCWPFFHLACMLRSTELVPAENKPAVDGVMLALAAWAQVWHASRAVPWLFSACAGVWGRLYERASEAADAASSKASTAALHFWESASSCLLRIRGNWWAAGLAGLAAALAVASLILKALELANALLTFGIMVGIAIDSARCAARRGSEAVPSRLSFWVVATAWLWLCSLPLGAGSLFAAWTPLVLAVAVATGEWLLKAVFRLCHAALKRCRAAACAHPSPSVSPGASDEEQHERPQVPPQEPPTLLLHGARPHHLGIEADSPATSPATSPASPPTRISSLASHP